MKNKKQMTFIGVAVLVVVFLLIGVGVYNGKTEKVNKKVVTEVSKQEKEETKVSDSDVSGEDKEEPTEEKAPEKEKTTDTDQEVQDSAPEEKDVPIEENEPTIEIENGNTVHIELPSEKKEEEIVEITFPYKIPNTNLMVNRISDYAGIYLEDGQDTEVQSVCAMLVTNVGNTPIEYAEVTVKGDSKELLFSISTLPAGAAVVVQEANQSAYQEFKPLSFEAECAEIKAFEMSAEQVKVEETADGSLRVTNLTDQEIPCVRVFYKLYMPEEEVYVGGITYVAKITELKANASSEVKAKHYLPGNSKIMMIRTYDSF